MTDDDFIKQMQANLSTSFKDQMVNKDVVDNQYKEFETDEAAMKFLSQLFGN